MKIALSFLGCRLNEAENEHLARSLVAAGHWMVSPDDKPDVIVLNTCGVTADAMRKSRNYARRMAALRPRILVLMGCAVDLMQAGENPLRDDELVQAARDAAVTPPAHEMRVLRILAADKQNAATAILGAIRKLGEVASAPKAAYPLRMRSFIKIQDGCNNRCTYCAVRLARGPERSLSTAEILDEIRRCLELGEREIVLTGVQLGAWREGNRSLHHLIRDILDTTDVQRLRMSSIEPWHLRPELWELWRDRRLCPHFHIPVQSGSDAVLAAMQRRTPIDKYLDKVAAIRAQIPGVRISTDLIVGFPGEDDAMWRETMEFIERAQFDAVHLFRFSPRPGTAAAEMPDQLPADVKRRRWNEAENRIRDIQRTRLEAAIGSVADVLWECARKTENGRTRWQGYAGNYLQFERWFAENAIHRGDITREIFTPSDIDANL